MNYKPVIERYSLVLLERFESIIKKIEQKHGNEIHIELDSPDLPNFCKILKDDFNFRLAIIICTDERITRNAFAIRYVFTSDIEGLYFVILILTEHKFPSIADIFPVSIKYEQEIKEMFGLIPEGSSDTRARVLHDFPESLFPLTRDSKPYEDVTSERSKPDFTPVRGVGICEIPVGPIHAGIIEPGHFRFSVLGEEIIHLETRLGYTHKGIEKIAESTPLENMVFLSERISGDESVANSSAFCRAVEQIAQLEIPQRGEQIRLIFAELERIYNHLGTLGGMINDVGYAYGSSRLNIIKERIMQLNEMLSGNRILFGVNRIGGVNVDLSDETLDTIHSVLDRTYVDFENIFTHLQSNSSVMDRLRNVGIIKRHVIKDLGALGISAKCAGLDIDARWNKPYGYYKKLNIGQKKSREYVAEQVELQKRIGDVLSRFMVRVDELRQSKMIIDSITSLEEDKLFTPLGKKIQQYSSGFGYAESHRGETMHWVMIGENNSIFRYKIRTASFCNWPALEQAVIGNNVLDFPLINKSFDLSYSGNDL